MGSLVLRTEEKYFAPSRGNSSAALSDPSLFLPLFVSGFRQFLHQPLPEFTQLLIRWLGFLLPSDEDRHRPIARLARRDEPTQQKSTTIKDNLLKT